MDGAIFPAMELFDKFKSLPDHRYSGIVSP